MILPCSHFCTFPLQRKSYLVWSKALPFSNSSKHSWFVFLSYLYNGPTYKNMNMGLYNCPNSTYNSFMSFYQNVLVSNKTKEVNY